MRRHEPTRLRATVTEVRSVRGGMAEVGYLAEDGAEGVVEVLAEGWGDGYGGQPSWPPRVGDRVTVSTRTVVVAVGRPG